MEEKQPPGWVMLTRDETGSGYAAPWRDWRYLVTEDGIATAWQASDPGDTFDVTEPPAEVARLIAAAEAAERRARALPVMAAVCFLARATHPAADVDTGKAVDDAAAILDAIDARGEG